MDAATISAIAALVVATIAMVIATAQATQQYFITGQGIRLCDSVVFADMPGQGRRIWQASQFRFRVVYSIPQISLPNDFWPTDWSVSHKDRQHSLPNLLNYASDSLVNEKYIPVRGTGFGRDRRRTKKVVSLRTGEAAWVSFSKIVYYSCHRDIRYDLVERDVDRCPADLPTVPMPVSLRDVVAMALSVGMHCTGASFTARSLSMQGPAGILATSQHPVLGPLLHFTPGDTSVLHGIVRTGHISALWLARTWDACIVARRRFYHRDRRNVEKIGGIWIQRVRSLGAESRNIARIPENKRNMKSQENRMRRKAVVISSETDPTPAPHRIHPPLGERRGFHDGQWEIVYGGPPGMPTRLSLKPGFATTHIRPVPPQIFSQLSQENQLPAIYRPAGYGVSGDGTIKRVPSHMSFVQPVDGMSATYMVPGDGLRPVSPRTFSTFPPGTVSPASHMKPGDSSKRRAEKDKPGPSIRNDSAHRKFQTTVEDASDNSDLDQTNGEGFEGKMEIPHQPTIIPGSLPTVSKFSDKGVSTSEATERARKRQTERNESAAKIAKDEEIAETLERDGRAKIASGVRLIGWRKGDVEEPHESGILPEGPEEKPLTKEEEEILSREAQRKKERKARDEQRHIRIKERSRAVSLYGRINWFWLCQCDIIPGFWATPWRRFEDLDWRVCLGAMKVILNALLGFTDENSLRYVNGRRGFTGPSREWMVNGNTTWPEPIPVLELYQSYSYQVARGERFNNRIGQIELLELMRLDAWLSLCGRTEEILFGRNDLIKQTPAMVELIFSEFSIDFIDLDQSDLEGGMQENQELAMNVMDFLLDEELSGAEQMYILVALLRAAKVGLSILEGADTRALEEILQEDILVHMV